MQNNKVRNFCSIAIFCFVALFFAQNLHAGDNQGGIKQFQQKFAINNLNGVIILVGLSSDAKEIQKLFNITIDEVKRVYGLLDASDRNSEVSKVNSSAGDIKGVKVSWQVLEAFKTAYKLSEWTDGVFDIVANGNNYRSISFDDKSSMVALRKDNARVSFDHLIEGLLADYIVTMIKAANMENVLVKVGNVFRGTGQSINGTWKVEVQEYFATDVQHVLKLSIIDSGLSAISVTDPKYVNLLNHRTGQNTRPDCKGAVIIMNEAALAEGVAYAAFAMGFDEGVKFLEKFNKARGLLVDSHGQFYKTKGM